MNDNNFYNLLENSIKKYKSKLIYQQRDGWSWKQITWQDLESEIKSISCFFIDLGFKKGDRVIINCVNTVESLSFELALYLIGGITIPVKCDDEIEKIVNNTEQNYYIVSNNKETLENILSRGALSKRIIKAFIITDENINIEEKYINYKNVVQFGSIKRKKLKDQMEEISKSIASDAIATIFYQFNGQSIEKTTEFSQEKIINILRIIQKELKFITEENQAYSYLPTTDLFSKFISLLNLNIGNRGAFASNLKDFYDDVLEVMPSIIYITNKELEIIIDEFKLNSDGSIKDKLGGKLKYILTNRSLNNGVKLSLEKVGITTLELDQLTVVD